MAHDELPRNPLGLQPDGSFIFYTDGETSKLLWEAIQDSTFTQAMQDDYRDQSHCDFVYRTWGPADDCRTHLTPQNEAAQLWLMTNYPGEP